MPRSLGHRTASVALDSSGSNPYGNGFWVGQVTPSIWGTVPPEFEAYHIAVIGPSGSQLQLWIEQDFYSTTPRGDINEWDPQQTMHLRAGQTLNIYWNVGGTSFPQHITAPIFNIWIRESSVV